MNQTPEILGQRFAQHDAFAREVGVKLLDVSQGHAKVKLDLTDKHHNSFGTVHGGVIFTLADVAFAIAANSHGTVAMAINVSISYLKALTEGTLYAEANEISRNPKLSTYAVDVTNGAGERIATFHGMTYRKKDPIPGG
jgi:acyl-CoA thioesterase